MNALEREYRLLSHFIGLMFLTLPVTAGIGSLLLGIVGWMKDEEIKRRVAGLGIPYSVWEEDLKPTRFITVSTYFFFTIILIAGILGYLIHHPEAIQNLPYR